MQMDKTRIVEAGEGEPLILLHGTGGHIEAYARNIKGLSEKFRVIVLICLDMVIQTNQIDHMQ